MKSIMFIYLIFLISNNIEAQSKSVNIQDSLALVDLYNATNGPNWINNSNWLHGPIHTWFGVYNTSIDTTRISSLHLSHNNLTGYIPISICNLTEIGAIYFDDNNLTGTIPKSIGRLTKCGYVGLENNQLSGSIPDSISKLIVLHSFFIYNNNFTGAIPASMNQLLYLDIFRAYHNQLDGLPDFSGIPSVDFAEYEFENNNLTFEDLEPNMVFGTWSVSDSFYAPQMDSINLIMDTTVLAGSVIDMHCTIGGKHNIYQWSKDGVDISGAIDSVYTLNPVLLTDSGNYTCYITNSIVPGLSYHRRLIKLHVHREEGINENSLENAIRVYPNPAGDKLFLDLFFNSDKKVKITMYNLIGDIIKLIDDGIYSNKNIIINNSDLSSGVYFIKIETPSETIIKKQVIIK